MFIISGASCVGKSTVLQRLVSDGYCSLAPKYSTRKNRSGLYDDVQSTEELNESCNITYEMYHNGYGINTSEIKKMLINSNQGIIISDIEAIKKIIEIFGNNLKIVCIILLNRRIENFVNTMFIRDNIKCENEMRNSIFEVSKELTNAYNGNNKDIIAKVELKFEHLIRKCYDNDSFISFWDRYKSIINSYKIFNENQDIFKYSVSYDTNSSDVNSTFDDVYIRCVNIFREGDE